jgi:hypothetical protein
MNCPIVDFLFFKALSYFEFLFSLFDCGNFYAKRVRGFLLSNVTDRMKIERQKNLIVYLEENQINLSFYGKFWSLFRSNGKQLKLLLKSWVFQISKILS